MEFRTLRPDEIEIRVGTVNNTGASLLLYKDARCDMTILDETVGPSNWQRRHRRENANCIVSIWDPKKAQWIDKEDTGTKSATEEEKGLASDSFKRACVNWGIGRELYTSPLVKIACQTQPKKNGYGYELVNKFQFWGTRVVEIEYDDTRCIRKLVICDRDGNIIYNYEDANRPAQKTVYDRIRELAEKSGKSEEEICRRAGVARLEDMHLSQADSCVIWLENGGA